ncbi:hypothetical protein M5D96_012804, partial [Drosophila gunungcola]
RSLGNKSGHRDRCPRATADRSGGHLKLKNRDSAWPGAHSTCWTPRYMAMGGPQHSLRQFTIAFRRLQCAQFVYDSVYCLRKTQACRKNRIRSAD